MLDTKGFDLWADGYDKAVGLSDEENTYPFAGYRDVLGGIFRIVMEKPGASVLDLGFGTGTLTAKLYEHGCAVYGQDFSPRMIELASAKMPAAQLYPGDLTDGLAEPLRARTYDFIVATYSLHHLTDAQKVPFLRMLADRLAPGGMILIGDVAFETRAALERCREAAGEEWDEEEFYFVADELREDFPDLTYTQVSDCAGILTLPRRP
jgi:putative AdoMet-dependent methyltransferase